MLLALHGHLRVGRETLLSFVQMCVALVRQVEISVASNLVMVVMRGLVQTVVYRTAEGKQQGFIPL